MVKKKVQIKKIASAKNKKSSFWKNKTLVISLAVVIIAVLGFSFWYFLSPNDALAGQAVSSGKKCANNADCKGGQACVTDYTTYGVGSNLEMQLTKNKVCCSKGSCSYFGKCYPNAKAYSEYYECGNSKWFYAYDNLNFNQIGPTKKTISDGNVWKNFGGKCDPCLNKKGWCTASNVLKFDSLIAEWQISELAYKNLQVGCADKNNVLHLGSCLDSQGKAYEPGEMKSSDTICVYTNWFVCNKESKSLNIKSGYSSGLSTYTCSYDQGKYLWKQDLAPVQQEKQGLDLKSQNLPTAESVSGCYKCSFEDAKYGLKCISSNILGYGAGGSWIVLEDGYNQRVGCGSDSGCIDIEGKAFKSSEIKAGTLCYNRDWYKCDAKSKNLLFAGFKCVMENNKYLWKQSNFDFCTTNTECVSGLKCTPVYSKSKGSAISIYFDLKTSDNICCPSGQCGLNSPAPSCGAIAETQKCQSDGTWGE